MTVLYPSLPRTRNGVTDAFIILLFSAISTTVLAQTPSITVRQGLPGNKSSVPRFIYGNGTFLTATVVPTQFFTSTDGNIWNRIPGPDLGVMVYPNSYQTPDFVFGAGRWVIVSDSGKIFSSPDLVNWTKCTVATTQTFTAVQYYDSVFYAIGDSATMYSSSDGLTWTAQTIGASPGETFLSAAYGNGYLVIASQVPDSADLYLYRSSNGAAGPWTVDTITNGDGALKFAKGHFYLLEPGVEVSTDAQNWTTLPGLTGYDVFEDSSLVYLDGLTSNAAGNEFTTLATSADGINFNTPYDLPFYGQYGVYLNGHYFVYSGSFGATGSEESTDGINFGVMGSTGPSAATNGSNYIKVSPTYQWAYIFTSSDYNTWTPVDTIGTGLTAVVSDSNGYLAEGQAVYTSPNGTAWSNAGSSPRRFDQDFNFTYGGGIYLAWWAYFNYDTAWYSHDGVNWMASQLPPPTNPDGVSYVYWPSDVGHITNVRYVNGRFFMMASNDEGPPAAIYTSTDGSNFTTVGLANKWPANFLAQSYDDVVYVPDSAKYYIFGVGSSGSAPPAFFSVSTPDPLDTSIVLQNNTVVNDLPAGTIVSDGYGISQANFTQGGYHFTYSHGHFVGTVVGSPPGDPESYLIWSSDGANWNSYPLNGSTMITSTIAAGDTFRMEGINNYEIIANFSGSGTPLPVTLLDFNAVPQNNSSVLLTWQTTLEQNSRDFVIQRSTDGSHFDSIGVVAAAGNSSATLDYRFTDGSPSQGYDYYRLLLTDLDGSYQASAVKRVLIERSSTISVYPNPAQDQLTIQSTATLAGAVTVYDEQGGVVLQTTINGYSLTLSLKNWPSGIYYLLIRQPDGSQYRQQIVHTN